METEYISLTEAAKEIIWIQNHRLSSRDVCYQLINLKIQLPCASLQSQTTRYQQISGNTPIEVTILGWCRAQENWTEAEWNQVGFSNESRFNLSHDDNRVRVWRPNGEHRTPVFALQRHTAPTAGARPSRSPYLSPIAYIWDHLGRRVENPTSSNELEKRLQKIWDEMCQDIIHTLYTSMSDRIISSLRTTEGSTGYY
ncbi:transposable element Tcb2 transposase [Trichonephila clavipes]|nr:transposable element Tcb2 transposase [Trichonephila clavipes]